MKPYFVVLLISTLFMACQKDEMPTTVSLLACPFEVEDNFSLSIPCDWRYEHDDDPGDGPSGQLSGNHESIVYLCGPLAFSDLESVNIPDGAKNIETVFVDNGRIMLYTKVYGEANYLLAYGLSSDDKQRVRFVVRNLKDHQLIREILLTINFK